MMDSQTQCSDSSLDKNPKETQVFPSEDIPRHSPEMNGIPTAAERYYAQPRFGSTAGLKRQNVSPAKTDKSSSTIREEFGNSLEDEDDQEKKPVRKKRKIDWVQSSPMRHSGRLVARNVEDMQNIIRKRLALFVTEGFKTTTCSEARNKALYDPKKPFLSDDPQDFHTTRDDCRLHLATTLDDRLSLRGAITPTIFDLKERLLGWKAEFVWKLDSSYIEVLEICMLDFYDFALTKVPDLDPLSLPDMIALLPWNGKISDFRSSPNWPSGW